MTKHYEAAAMILVALQDKHIAQATDPRHQLLMRDPVYAAGFQAAHDSLLDLEQFTDELMMREGMG